jgi:hypothetical protein
MARPTPHVYRAGAHKENRPPSFFRAARSQISVDFESPKQQKLPCVTIFLDECAQIILAVC